MTEHAQAPLSASALAQWPTVYRDNLLRGRHVLISGGAVGLGRAVAYLFSRLGAEVSICDSDAGALATTATGIQHHLQRSITTHHLDIRDPDAVDKCVNATASADGEFNCLINCPGPLLPGEAMDIELDTWQQVIELELNGAWFTMHSAARYWQRHQCTGSIVNIAADIWRGLPGLAANCAAAAGVIFTSRGLAVEWAPLGIRVNCIAPGAISGGPQEALEPSVRKTLFRSNPLLRCGDAMDIAEAAVYLCAPSGKFITGECLNVDGGQQLWGEIWPNGQPEFFTRPDTSQ